MKKYLIYILLVWVGAGTIIFLYKFNDDSKKIAKLYNPVEEVKHDTIGTVDPDDPDYDPNYVYKKVENQLTEEQKVKWKEGQKKTRDALYGPGGYLEQQTRIDSLKWIKGKEKEVERLREELKQFEIDNDIPR